MAVTVTKRPKSTSHVASDDGLTGITESTEIYDVTCNAGELDEISVLAADGIPLIGDPLLTNTYMRCNDVAASQLSLTHLTVTVRYKVPSIGEDNPLLQPAKLSWEGETFERPVSFDYNGKPLCTKNGEMYRGITRKITEQILVIEKNKGHYNPVLYGQYMNTINTSTFAGAPAGTAYMDRISARTEQWTSGVFYVVTARVHFRFGFQVGTTDAKAWWHRRVHQGFYHKEQSTNPLLNGKIGRAVDEFGEPTIEPVLLKEDGFRQTDLTQPYIQEFQIQPSSNFNNLSLF